MKIENFRAVYGEHWLLFWISLWVVNTRLVPFTVAHVDPSVFPVEFPFFWLAFASRHGTSNGDSPSMQSMLSSAPGAVNDAVLNGT